MVKLAPSPYPKNPQGAAAIAETLHYPVVTPLSAKKKAILFSSNNDCVLLSYRLKAYDLLLKKESKTKDSDRHRKVKKGASYGVDN